MCRRSTGALVGFAAGGAVGLVGPAAGQGHEALIIANPSDAESLYVANVYAAARDLPATNVLFFDPSAGDFEALAAVNHKALLGELERRGIEEAVDYVLLTPDAPFFVSAGGLVNDPCSPVTRFSLGTAYGIAPFADLFLSPPVVGVQVDNEYASDTTPLAFDSQRIYNNGSVSTTGNGRRSFIGAHIGYTGQRGNTLSEVLSTIQTGVASDGTLPTAPIQLIETTDSARSGPRDGAYATVAAFINGVGFLNGANAETFVGTVPGGGETVSGVFTGLASPNIDGGDFSFAPGAYADHLTSFGATFNLNAQTKVSRWIAKGATLTSGAVQEPCNYPGKFASAQLFQFAVQGVTLGEAHYRSVGFVPLQLMTIGDPLARPWGAESTIEVPGFPTGSVSGVVELNPSVTPGGNFSTIVRVEAYVDGVLRGVFGPTEMVTLDTTELGDGARRVRLVAIESGPAEVPGTWTGMLGVDNTGGGVSLTTTTPAGVLNDTYVLNVAPSTPRGSVEEVRVLHRGRVVAASQSVPATISLHGQLVGAGEPELIAEIQYADGSVAQSSPLTLDVEFDSSSPSDNAAPVAFSYELRSPVETSSLVVPLPADHSSALGAVTYRLISGPTNATVLSGAGIDADGPYRVLERTPGEPGEDEIVFEIEDGQGRTSTGTVRLVFGEPGGDLCPADQNADGVLNGADFNAWLQNFSLGLPQADVNEDGMLNGADFNAWLQAFSDGCG